MVGSWSPPPTELAFVVPTVDPSWLPYVVFLVWPVCVTFFAPARLRMPYGKRLQRVVTSRAAAARLEIDYQSVGALLGRRRNCRRAVATSHLCGSILLCARDLTYSLSFLFARLPCLVSRVLALTRVPTLRIAGVVDDVYEASAVTAKLTFLGLQVFPPCARFDLSVGRVHRSFFNGTVGNAHPPDTSRSTFSSSHALIKCEWGRFRTLVKAEAHHARFRMVGAGGRRC